MYVVKLESFGRYSEALLQMLRVDGRRTISIHTGFHGPHPVGGVVVAGEGVLKGMGDPPALPMNTYNDQSLTRGAPSSDGLQQRPRSRPAPACTQIAQPATSNCSSRA